MRNISWFTQRSYSIYSRMAMHAFIYAEVCIHACTYIRPHAHVIYDTCMCIHVSTCIFIFMLALRFDLYLQF